MVQSTTNIVLFDGDCGFCNRMVRFIIRRDRAGRFRFAALQGDAGRRVLADAGFAAEPPQSAVLVDASGVHLYSEAVLRIARQLDGPWPALVVFRVIPRAVRDALYRWFARHRRQWFAPPDACTAPTPAEQARFID